MVDREIVNRRLRELDLRLGALTSLLATRSASDYQADLSLRAQVERHLQLAIQAAIDIAAHIAAQDTAAIPEDYGDAFVVLARAGIIDPDLADGLRLASGMRNVLVHGYVEIDDEIVWGSLGDLGDLRSFAVAVTEYLDAADPV